MFLFGKVYACVCACASANAGEDHLSLLLVSWQLFKGMIPELARALMCTQSLCVCVCGRMYRGRPSICAFEKEQRTIQVSRRTLSVWIANAARSGGMWSGQLWRGRVDVCARVCVRVYLCVCVCVCVWGCITGAFRCLFLKWRAKSNPIVMSHFVSVNCKCRSSVVMCSWQLWRGQGDECARVRFCVSVCLCLSVTLAIEWWTMRMRTRLCSDQ